MTALPPSSVERAGPKGYDVQYLITIWIALLQELEQPGRVNLVVEGREDAELTLHLDNSVLLLSLQAKYQQGDLDPDLFAKWLAHFDAHQSDQCLVHRIQNNSQHILLLATKRRCGDKTRSFLRSSGDLSAHVQQPIKPEHLNEICSAFENAYPVNGSRLETKRRQTCLEIAARLKRKGQQEFWKRILVWEQLTDLVAKQQIFEALVQFRIPSQDRAEVLALLLQVIRDARDSGENAMLATRAILDRYDAGRMLTASEHLPRPEEFSLGSILDSERVLWLTGRPLCGKSQLASAIAQKRQDQGIECLKTEDVQEALRFLDSSSPEGRLVVLDDPLTFDPDKKGKRKMIAHLAARLPKKHRLIVTSKLEELSSLVWLSENTISDPYEAVWHDVTVKDRSYNTSLWKRLCVTHAVSESILETVLEHLETVDFGEMLQPGQLSYLARNPPPTGIWGPDAVITHARNNAKAIAADLADDDSTREIQLALGMCASGSNGISELEIGFALTLDLNGPGMHPDGMRMISFGNALTDDPDRQFPKYSTSPELPVQFREQLRSFEKQGYLRIERSKWFFTHPDYREAFQRRIFLEPPSVLPEITHRFRHAFESLSIDVGQSACRFIWLLLSSNHPLDPCVKKGLLDIAVDAARHSIFPNIRSSLLQILLNESRGLVSEDLLILSKNVSNNVRTVLWEHDIPWIHASKKGWLTDLNRSTRQLEENHLNSIIETFSKSEINELLPDKVADALNTAFLHEKNFIRPSRSILRTILKSNQVFIRADAAEVCIRSGLIAEAEFLDILFSDASPLVQARCVAKMLEMWPTLHRSLDLAKLCSSAVQSLQQPAIAVICCYEYVSVYDEIATFGNRWNSLAESDWRFFWSYWTKAMAAMLRALAPLRYRLSSDDYYASATKAAGIVNGDDFFDLANAWIDWIHGQLQHSWVDDWVLSVVDASFEAPRLAIDQRNQIVNRSLNYESTDAVGMAVKDLVDHWSELSDSECVALTVCLSSNRTDLVWLQSIAIVRSNVPEKFVLLITGSTGFFELPVVARIASISAPMRQACAHLTMGDVGYSSAFSVAPASRAFWEEMLDYSLQNENDLLFRPAVAHLLTRLCWNGYKSNLSASWESCCKEVTELGRGIIFAELLACSLNWSDPPLGEAWHSFLSLPVSPKERKHYADEIIDCIEGIEYRSRNLKGLIKLLGPDFIEKELLIRSPGDLHALTINSLLENAAEHDATLKVLTYLEGVYFVHPPRLVFFHDIFISWLGRMDNEKSKALGLQIKSVREAAFKKASEQGDQHSPFRFTLSNWMAPHLAALDSSANADASIC